MFRLLGCCFFFVGKLICFIFVVFFFFGFCIDRVLFEVVDGFCFRMCIGGVV